MIDDEEVLQAREKFMKAIQTFLKKFSRYPFGVMPKVLLISWERFFEIKHVFTDKQYQPDEIQELMSKLFGDVRNINEELSDYTNSLSWNRPIFYDNDEHSREYLEKSSKAITPVLPTEEPEYSLNTLFDSSPKFDYLEEFSGELMPTSIINEDRIKREHEEYISLMENLLTINLFNRPEEIDIFTGTDDVMPPGIKSDDYDSEGDIHFLEELLSNDSIPLPENESSNFDHHDDLTFPRPPSEPPDVEVFFDFEPNSGELISAVMNNIDELNEDECFDLGGGEIDVFCKDDDYFPFIFVIRIFLPYFTYPEVSPLLLFTRSEDTIFDPDISI
nr:hypothetical protein [Tanacetum cinerariifolium]